MIILAIDFETTGIDREKDEVTEVGAVLWSTGKNRIMECSSYFVKNTIPISQEITDITGITQGMIDRFGYESVDGFDKLQDMVYHADAFVGQNVVRFDKAFYENWAKRSGEKPIEKLWIDTRTDLPGVEGKHLGYMACDAGFINFFPHAAVSDCLTVLRLVSMHKIEDVVARAQSPTLIVKADVSFADNALAKKRKYSWHPQSKMWWRGIKQIDLEKEIQEAPFNVSLVKDIPLETLWYS
jgi:DNA polymerase III alpha subunit (gram-positive type)